MSQTLTRRNRPNRTLFHSNPVLSRLSRAEARDVSNAATYAGIAAKTSYFFAVVDDCVREGYPKSYEWSAAFGLVFTVIWIYLKILDLLMQLAGDKDN